jgi:hypothetical protein
MFEENLNYEGKEIYYFDKEGNKEVIGTIINVDTDFDQLEIEFTKFGKALYKNINSNIGIEEAIRILKTNKKETSYNGINDVLYDAQEMSKGGLGNVIIGDLEKKIKLKNVVHDEKSLETIAEQESFEKRNINFNAIKVYKDGLDIKGKHIFVKTANSKESEEMLYMEYEALKVLKKNGVNVPDIELKIIKDKPFLIMERFDKKSDFTVSMKSGNFYTESNSGVYNSSQLYTMKEIVRNNSKVSYEYQLINQSYLIAANFLNKLNESQDESIKEYLEISNKNSKKELFKVLSFNLLIGNNDMHGENIGFLLNSKLNKLNGNIDFKLAPFYDITPHSYYTNESSLFNKSLNKIELEDLRNTSYRGLLENKDFINSFEEAKKMVEEYKDSLEKRFKNKPEELDNIKKYFNKLH